MKQIDSYISQCFSNGQSKQTSEITLEGQSIVVFREQKTFEQNLKLETEVTQLSEQKLLVSSQNRRIEFTFSQVVYLEDERAPLQHLFMKIIDFVKSNKTDLAICAPALIYENLKTDRETPALVANTLLTKHFDNTAYQIYAHTMDDRTLDMVEPFVSKSKQFSAITLKRNTGNSIVYKNLLSHMLTENSISTINSIFQYAIDNPNIAALHYVYQLESGLSIRILQPIIRNELTEIKSSNLGEFTPNPEFVHYYLMNRSLNSQQAISALQQGETFQSKFKARIARDPTVGGYSIASPLQKQFHLVDFQKFNRELLTDYMKVDTLFEYAAYNKYYAYAAEVQRLFFNRQQFTMGFLILPTDAVCTYATIKNVLHVIQGASIGTCLCRQQLDKSLVNYRQQIIMQTISPQIEPNTESIEIQVGTSDVTVLSNLKFTEKIAISERNSSSSVSRLADKEAKQQQMNDIKEDLAKLQNDFNKYREELDLEKQKTQQSSSLFQQKISYYNNSYIKFLQQQQSDVSKLKQQFQLIDQELYDPLVQNFPTSFENINIKDQSVTLEQISFISDYIFQENIDLSEQNLSIQQEIDKQRKANVQQLERSKAHINTLIEARVAQRQRQLDVEMMVKLKNFREQLIRRKMQEVSSPK